MENLLNKGDVIKTSLSDSTMVLKVEGNDALLFTGRQFVVAHGVQKDHNGVFWNQGDYYDELPDDIFEGDVKEQITDLHQEQEKNFSYETFCKYVKNKMSFIYQNDEGEYEILQDTEALQEIVFEKIGLQTEEKTLRYIYDNSLFDELNEVIVQATTPYKYKEAYKNTSSTENVLDNLFKTVGINSAFNNKQIEQIYLGLKQEVDINKYADPKYNWEQMEQIRFGLMSSIDIEAYVNPKFNSNQMREIRRGLENEVDISPYITPEFDYMQIGVITEGLVRGLDVSSYAKLENDWETMDSMLNELDTDLENEDDWELEA